jgi:adenylate cyclase
MNVKGTGFDMGGRREVSFEVHVMQGQAWHIQARYPAAKGKVAIEDAKEFGQKQGYKGARVIRESYDPDSGLSEEVVVFKSSPDKKPAGKLQGAGPGVKSADTEYGRQGTPSGRDVKSADTAYGRQGAPGGRADPQAQNGTISDAAAPELQKRSFVSSFVKFLLSTLFCIAVAAGMTFTISALLGGSAMGNNTKTNLLSATFIGTFILLALVMGYLSLKKSGPAAAPAPKARAKARAKARPKKVKKKKAKKLDTSKFNLDDEDENDDEEEKLSFDKPEEELDEKPAEEPSGTLSPHGEKQKVYLMKYLGEALAQVQASDVTMDAFNKFGINLFLAGGCEILNEKRSVDPRDSNQILAEAVTLLGFKKEEAIAFSDKYQEYLLADARYMQIFQAGRNAMNTYFTEEASGLKQMTVAIQDWNKPKQKEENSGPVTVMFTDIVGSTAMTQDLGDAIAQQIVRAHNRIVREALTQFAGKEIKHTGDGIMASFPVTSNSVEASVAMQRGCMAHNEANPDLPLHIKIGLNAGEPIAEDNDLFGTTVQMAARIVDKAQAEEIFASEIVQGICSGKDIKFKNRGGFPMKGFENDPTLYEVVWDK